MTHRLRLMCVALIAGLLAAVTPAHATAPQKERIPFSGDVFFVYG